MTKALLVFDSPGQKNARLPTVENVLLTGRIAEHRERREFTLRHDETPDPVLIACTEPI